MIYTDYSTVRIIHQYKKAQFTRAAEADLLAHSSRGSSPAFQDLARERLGDGLIHIGRLLKRSRLTKQTSEGMMNRAEIWSVVCLSEQGK